MRSSKSKIASSIPLFLCFLHSFPSHYYIAQSFTVSLPLCNHAFHAFLPHNIRATQSSSILQSSKVTDPDGVTPHQPPIIYPTIDPKDVPELHYNASDHPIAHQPWRRGDTDGCEDPIDALWRIEAEELIRRSVLLVGAEVLDITWYMAAVVITLDHESISKATGDMGPEVRIRDSEKAVFIDPKDKKPSDDYGWYEGEEDGRVMVDGKFKPMPGDPYPDEPKYSKDELREDTPKEPIPRPSRASTVRNMNQKEFDRFVNNGMSVMYRDSDARVSMKLSMEDFNENLAKAAKKMKISFDEAEEKAARMRSLHLCSEDLAEFYPDEYEKLGGRPEIEGGQLVVPMMERVDGVDTTSLSIIAKSILDALEEKDIEERLRIVSRHEVILTSNLDESFVNTQQDFDEARGKRVMVQTVDPFDSNRVLDGFLVERNALDVVLNVKGRMVTIPMNFVDYVQVKE